MTAEQTRTFRIETVDDHIRNTATEMLQFPNQIQGFLKAQCLGQQDRDKSAPSMIFEEFVHLFGRSLSMK